MALLLVSILPLPSSAPRQLTPNTLPPSVERELVGPMIFLQKALNLPLNEIVGRRIVAVLDPPVTCKVGGQNRSFCPFLKEYSIPPKGRPASLCLDLELCQHNLQGNYATDKQTHALISDTQPRDT